ncbi:replication-relaxation family protein [Bacillus cereus]|uniref:replication-relaxation family protein n=1 Tax=Bacillus cereus group TaxID=86661 RepID=UPI0021B2B6F9|nr:MULTISPECIES: replication-relaxation family protein [Bacillus cereus group]MDF9626839.1 replication-relaxation family protein [Bacillus cereus]
MLTNRDKQIIAHLQQFRCMSRNDIIDLHFKNVKNAVTCCNTVTKRLCREEYIDVDTSQRPYVYFPFPSPIRKNSQKIRHFLAIVDVYKQLLQVERPKLFQVEPKYHKGYMEPDIFTIWRKSPFFIEVQKSVYSKAVMQAKIKRYELYFHSLEWQKESWQPKHTTVFPSLLILTDSQYPISSSKFRIFQASSIQRFLEQVTPKTKSISVQVGSSRKKL